MIITNAMGPGAGVEGQGGRAPGRGPRPGRQVRAAGPPTKSSGDSKCIPGRPGAASGTAGPRREGPGVRERDYLPRTGMRMPPPTGDAFPGDRLRIPYGRPPPRYDRPGVRGSEMGSRGRRYRRRAPRGTRRPTSSCGGTGRLIRFIPRGAIAVPGARAQRTGAPVLPVSAMTSAAPPPRGTRTSRTPGTGRRVRRAVPAGDVPGAPPGRTSARYCRRYPVHRGAPRGRPPPRASRHVRRAAPPASSPGDRRAPVLLVGVPGARTAAGTPPGGVPRTAGDAGDDRHDVLPIASPVPGHLRYAIPAGARPRTGRSYAPGAPAGDVPAAPPAALGDRSPGYTAP